MKAQRERICVLGGGFGGLYTALRLEKMPWRQDQKPTVILVDKRDKFTFLPLLYEFAGELRPAVRPLHENICNRAVRRPLRCDAIASLTYSGGTKVTPGTPLEELNYRYSSLLIYVKYGFHFYFSTINLKKCQNSSYR